MNEQPRLRAVPGRREQQVIDWLGEREPAPSRDALEIAFAQLPDVRQRRAWPWTRVGERLRPEPFGSQQARLVALVVAVGLLLALFAGSVMIAGQLRLLDGNVAPDVARTSPGPAMPASPAVPDPSPSPVFPLSDPLYDLVIANDTRRLLTLQSDGSNRLPIALDVTGTLVSPEWGPAGSVLVQETSSSLEQIWHLDPSGARRSQVIVPCVDPCQSRNEASWSHDGKHIVFFQALGSPVNGIPVACGLALYEAAALTVTDVTSSPCAIIEERHPRFSPDDRKLAFWRSRSPGRVASLDIEDSAVFTRDLETGEEVQVTDWGSHATMLDWSPDGEWIVFVPDLYEPSAAEADLWRVHPDGSGLERLTRLDTDAVQLLRPRYSPDGRWILFMQVSSEAGELLAIPSGGGEPVPVLPGIDVHDFDVRAHIPEP